MKLLYLFGLIFSLCTAKAQSGESKLKTNADDNTLLWEISGNGLSAPSYLFGTFHLLCKEDINFSFQFPDPQYLGAKHTHLAWIKKFIPNNVTTATFISGSNFEINIS